MKNLSKLLTQVPHGLPKCETSVYIRPPCRWSSSRAQEKIELPLQKCLLVSKVTRYEFEQNRHRGCSPTQLEALIRRRGSDYEALLHYHRQQRDFERGVLKALADLGAEAKLVNRLTYSPSMINWCDVVIPCGGDGTFLLAASRIRDSRKPVIGFNSDPSRSEGRLCLPKWCSRDVKGALSAIKEGRFSWLHRSRIRTTVASDERLKETNQVSPVDLHKPILPRYNVPSHQDSTISPGGTQNSYGAEVESDFERWRGAKDETLDRNNQPGIMRRVLPFLALNEVFIGENVSARVSHLQINIDKSPRPTRTKSSGLCVSTGTGSTSWHLSINRLTSQSMMELLQLQWKATGEGLGQSKPEEYNAKSLADLYNDTLIFPSDDQRLTYSIRELISGDVSATLKGLKARGFAKTLHVKSRCVDAGLVIDGGMSFPFNDGTEATLEVHAEDALRTIVIRRD